MPGPLEALLVGRTLGDRYEVEEAIGRGGMSIVYRARDRRLDRPVALKVLSLPPGDAVDLETLRERLRREAAAAARIPPHPNVVQVYDHGTDPALELDFIVMELLPGRDLRDALAARRPGGVGEALRVLREAAKGVAAGHRAGIVHRDVKPGNILLVGEQGAEGVKILDFGIAKALEAAPSEELTRTGQHPHSPAYASPEQLRGVAALTPASDVYQLGLVGYELLTGERPFARPVREVGRGSGTPALPDSPAWAAVPPAVRDVVATALRPDPADRYPDADSFLEALLSADAGGAAPRTEPLPPPSAPPAAAVPWKAAGAVALALLGVWAVSRSGDTAAGPGDGPPPSDAAALDLAALEAEFRPLVRDAGERLREEAGSLEGAAAAEAVREAIYDLERSLAAGDLERHLEHYADRVDFHGADDAPRSRVERERRADVEHYPDREIAVNRVAVTFPAPGRARALVDRAWEFDGPDGSRSGAARLELGLELREGRWRVVSEEVLESYR